MLTLPTCQVVTSQESRTRQRNWDDCVDKLREIMTEASTMPKERNMNSKTKDRFHQVRLQEKKANQKKKESRSKTFDY